jgi:hypothetical protein
MLSKKGFMLGEYTLKIIISVLCLLLLFYLLFTLYSGYKKDKDIRNAKSVLDSLGVTMNLAKEKGQQQDFSVLGFEGWALISYQKGEKRPLECGDNCICLCPSADGGYNVIGIDVGMTEEEIQINHCNRAGVCKMFNEIIKKFYFNSNNAGKLIGDLKVEYKNNQFEIIKVTK